MIVAPATAMTDVLALLAPFGSPTPAGEATCALFVIVPAALAMPVIVITTEPPAGNAAIVLVTELPATMTAPHTAPPIAPPQVADTAVTPAGTSSENIAPFAALGPAFE